jgi:hypothetical protein
MIASAVEVDLFFREIDKDFERSKAVAKTAVIRKLGMFIEFLLLRGLRRSEGLGLKSVTNVDSSEAIVENRKN